MSGHEPVNLAGLASLAGDFGVVPKRCTATHSRRARPRVVGPMPRSRCRARPARAARGDYPAARIALREALRIYARTGPVADELAVRRDLAGALAGAGDLQGARDELSRAQRRAIPRARRPAARAGIALARADLALELNTVGRAQALCSRASLVSIQPPGERQALRPRQRIQLQREVRPGEGDAGPRRRRRARGIRPPLRSGSARPRGCRSPRPAVLPRGSRPRHRQLRPPPPGCARRS